MTVLMNATAEQVSTLDALVELTRELERSINGMQAARDGLLALAARWATMSAGTVDEADLSLRSVAAELATALRVSDRTVQRRMLAAEETVERFSAVWAAQGAGEISAGHARVIVDAGAHIVDPTARAEYAARALEFAREESPNRVRPIAERLAQQYEPRTIDERHADARELRGAWVTEHPDAMAELHMFGPSTLIHGAFARITDMSKVKSEAVGLAVGDGGGAPATDTRTLAHRRFDIGMDLLLTGAPAGHDSEAGLLSAITAHVSVTVPVLTLMGTPGAGSPAAELDGHGPIDPLTARMLAGASTGWDRLLTHPVTGGLLAVDRYRPSEQLRRHLRSRDQRCRFPTCGMPARDSDLDHTHDAAHGGSTAAENLGTLCRRHHILKHHTPWRVRQLGGGIIEWTSPTGRTYIDKPPPQHTVTFSDAGDGNEGHVGDTSMRSDLRALSDPVAPF